MPGKKKPAPKKSAPGKKSLAAKVAADWGVALPERLVRFFDQECAAYAERRIFGMKGFDSVTKMPLHFGAGELPMYAEYAQSMTGVAPTSYLPLAAAGKQDGTYFVAVELSKPELPVYFFDYESGFELYAPDFESFLGARLLKKGEKTPTERLRTDYDQAKKLYDQEKYAAAEALLAKAVVGLPEEPSRTSDEYMDLPGNAFNILGCCREELGRMEEAMKDYDRATKLGCTVAGLNICRRYEETGNWTGLLEYGERLRERIYSVVSEYAWFWVRNYLGHAYLETGNHPKAVIAYHQIRKSFATSDSNKITEAADGLRDRIQRKCPGADAAAQILSWFDPPAKTIGDARRAKLHAFWDRVPTGIAEGLLKAVGGGKLGKQRPADDVLDRILALDDVEIQHKKVEDLGFLKDFDRIVDLDLEGTAVVNLDVIATLTGLRKLNLRKTGITSLKALAPLVRLESLSCSENKLESLDGVQSMTRLSYLHAPESGIRDVRPLAGLPELEELTIYNNAIDDVSPLATCPRLKEISCFGLPKGFKGLTALATLPRLEQVNGSDASETDVAALRQARPDVDVDTGFQTVPARRIVYTKEALAPELAWWKDRARLGGAWKKILEKAYKDNADDADKVDEPSLPDLAKTLREDSIFANKRGLTTLAPMSHLKSADYLNASENEIADLSPLAGHAWLQKLLLRDNRIASLAPLSTLKRLEELRIDNNQVESLAGLESVLTLRELHADNNRIADLSELRGLSELRMLAITGNRVTSLEPLSGLKNLRVLYAYANAFQDLSPLAGCTRLQLFECFANPGLKGLLALKELAELRQVISHGSLAAEEVREFARLRPDVIVD